MAATVHSFAKINIGLYIGPPGMRSDGFHELRTVYQTIALHDTLKIELKNGKSGVEIRCKDSRVPSNESNTCFKMAERVMKALKLNGRVVISIEKRLPVQGGLGAASGNAVATLIGIERAAKKRLAATERMRICEEVGSDVPLFLFGGTVLGNGRGEQVFPLPDLPEINLVIATPEVGVSTPKAFAEWDRQFAASGSRAVLRPEEQTPKASVTSSGMTENAEKLTVSGQSDRLNMFSQSVYGWLDRCCCSPKESGVSARGGNRAEALLLDLVRTGIENDFERVVFPQFPELRDIKSVLKGEGARYASLSGSGSTVYGMFSSRAAAVKASKNLNARGIPATATTTLSRQQYWRKM